MAVAPSDTPARRGSVDRGAREELWPIGLHLIEQFVWTQVRWHYVQGAGEPCLLVVDELWLTLRSAEGGAFLETVARKGPKYWLGLAVASQEPADCLNSPHGLAIVHNSSTHLLLAMDRGALRVATAAFDLTPIEGALLEGAVPGQPSCCAPASGCSWTSPPAPPSRSCSTLVRPSRPSATASADAVLGNSSSRQFLRSRNTWSLPLSHRRRRGRTPVPETRPGTCSTTWSPTTVLPFPFRHGDDAHDLCDLA